MRNCIYSGGFLSSSHLIMEKFWRNLVQYILKILSVPKLNFCMLALWGRGKAKSQRVKLVFEHYVSFGSFLTVGLLLIWYILKKPSVDPNLQIFPSCFEDLMFKVVPFEDKPEMHTSRSFLGKNNHFNEMVKRWNDGKLHSKTSCQRHFSFLYHWKQSRNRPK